MAARKRSKTPPKRATRSLLAARPSLHLPRPAPLEPHHVDIVALGLIALGILLGGVAYAGWDGGALGNGAVTGLRFLLGALGYVVPAALLIAGALVLARELRPPVRPLRTGLLCLDRLDHAGAGRRARSGWARVPRRPASSGGPRLSRTAAGSWGRPSCG